MGSIATMLTLAIWHNAYTNSCYALAMPLLAWTGVWYGTYVYNTEHKKARLEYWLKPESTTAKWLKGKLAVTVSSIAISAGLTTTLALFIALATKTDWKFAIAIGALVPTAFAAIRLRPGNDFKDTESHGVSRATVISSRLASKIAVAVIIALYAIKVYTTNEVDSSETTTMDFDNLEQMAEAAGNGTWSRCSATNQGLRIEWVMQVLALYPLLALGRIENAQWEVQLLWNTAYMLKNIVAFTGLARCIEGATIAGQKLSRRQAGR